MNDSDEIELHSRFERREDVPWREIDDTILLLDLTNGDFFELDTVGAAIWRGLDGARTLGELAQGLAAEYEVAVETIGSDIIAFVTDLRAKNLVRRTG
jgi:hypothetical protein